MKKGLINFAHPAQPRSKINRALRNAVEGVEGITFNDLYSSYPDFLIDVDREQGLGSVLGDLIAGRNEGEEKSCAPFWEGLWSLGKAARRDYTRIQARKCITGSPFVMTEGLVFALKTSAFMRMCFEDRL